MALIKCPECGKEISDKAEACPNCGCSIVNEITVEISKQILEEEFPEKEKQEWKRKMKLLTSLGVIILSAIILFIGTNNLRAYSKAQKLMESKKYTDAIDAFKELNGYKDSEKLIEKCNYEYGMTYIKSGDYKTAKKILQLAGNSKEVDEAKKECLYQEAIIDFQDENYEAAYGKFHRLKEYRDSNEKIIECKYKIGSTYFYDGDYQRATKYLKDIKFKDSEEIIEYMHNNPYSLEKFVERYNDMMHQLDEKGEETADISIKKLATGTATLMSKAKLSFNNDQSGKNYQSKITNFNFVLEDFDEEYLKYAVCELYATIAGVDPNYTYEEVENTVSQILDNDSYEKNGILYSNYSMKGLLLIIGTRTSDE